MAASRLPQTLFVDSRHKGAGRHASPPYSAGVGRLYKGRKAGFVINPCAPKAASLRRCAGSDGAFPESPASGQLAGQMHQFRTGEYGTQLTPGRGKGFSAAGLFPVQDAEDGSDGKPGFFDHLCRF